MTCIASSSSCEITYAPIALFVYARPDHTRRTVEALLTNPEASRSDLIVFSDGARTPDKEDSVRRVREYISSIKGFRSLTVYHQFQNYGLAKSIVDGVSQVLADHDRVIVLEDDLVSSSYFLRYMNEALDRFSDDERVISVHGYVYPVRKHLPEAFFLLGADCWGWATWRRGWMHFNPDGQFLLDELKRLDLLEAFDLNGAYSYSAMLRGQINGSNDSWAVRWHASAFLANKLTLYPGRSLIRNIGNDSSGTHCRLTANFDSELSTSPINLESLVIQESDIARSMIAEFLLVQSNPPYRLMLHSMHKTLPKRLKGIVKDCLPPVLLGWFRRLSIHNNTTFTGPFTSWNQAEKLSNGYDSVNILDKVLDATLKVKSGKAVFERDSVLFHDYQFPWPVTSGLLWAAARACGRLSVLDFGGSLGSSYFQNLKLMEGLSSLHWSVIEQDHFVKAGRQYIQDEHLVFYSTIEECLAVEKPNVVLLSSVLQYLLNPYTALDQLMSCGAEIIIIDRTPFHDGKTDLVAVQNVADSIYPASYPLWILSTEHLMNYLSPYYHSVVQWPCPELFAKSPALRLSFHGLLLQRNNHDG